MKIVRCRDHMILFAGFLLALSACTSQTVKMIQPQTGATADCSGSSLTLKAGHGRWSLGGQAALSLARELIARPAGCRSFFCTAIAAQ